MGKRRLLKLSAATAATALIAVLLPDHAAFSDERRNPELVTLGMSVPEVEALMGQSSETCWNYDRGADSRERICFRDGLLHSSGRTRQEADRIYFETTTAPDWPPPSPSTSSTEVQFGMDPQAVTRLLGRPDYVDEFYWFEHLPFYADFADGNLMKFEKGEPVPVAGSPLSGSIVFFDIGSTKLAPQAEQAIETAVQQFEALRGSATVVLFAHTDASEARSHSTDLSQRRGEVVKNRLVALRIPRDRIEVRALGDSSPLVMVPPGTAEPQNRRVEIHVWRTEKD